MLQHSDAVNEALLANEEAYARVSELMGTDRYAEAVDAFQVLGRTEANLAAVLSEGERVQGYNEMGATVFLGNEEGGALVVQDGGQYIPKFATADDVASATGEEVYVERFSATGEREFHGWIDAVSRKIVQTG